MPDPMPTSDQESRPAANDAGHGGTDRIVVGVDGSDYSLHALRWALAEGQLRQLPVHAVLSWSMPALAGMGPVILPNDYDLQASAREQLDAILGDVGAVEGPAASSPVTSEVVEGNPALALLNAARQDASLLVVGSRGHGGFAGLLLGSVSQHCAAHAPCPVVVVHGPTG